MLKGDIDMMGLLFKHGFEYETKGGKEKGKSIYSVSRIVQLSRMLELFFGKYLQNCLQYQFENVYTVFS
ncbi:hypothetical protein IJM86_08380 [bacterium]|nr:hypothetical protein [bacterium]